MKGISRRNRKKERASEAAMMADFSEGAPASAAAAAGKKQTKKNSGKIRVSKATLQQQEELAQRKKVNHRSTDPKDVAMLRTLAAQRNRKGGRSTLLRTTQQQQQMQQQQQQAPPSAPQQPAASASTGAINNSSSGSKTQQQQQQQQQNRNASTSSSAPNNRNNTSTPNAFNNNSISNRVCTPQQRQQRQGDALLDSFRSRLSGSTFRLMNEQLYTTPSDFARQLLGSEAAYKEYHEGYGRQLQLWPVQPVDIILDCFRFSKSGCFESAFHNMEQRKRNEAQQQQQQQQKSTTNKPASWNGIPLGTVIGDFGCGNAQLARSLNAVAEQIGAVNKRKNAKIISSAGGDGSSQQQQLLPTSFRIHSMDLYAEDSDLVTACDMAHTPLEDECLDFAVFSLSLMSTNWLEFLIEAQRTLKKREGYELHHGAKANNNSNYRYGYGYNNQQNPSYGSGKIGSGGILKIIEVRSRMPNPDQFAVLVESLGFEFLWGDVVGEGYFCAFDFECVSKPLRRDPEAERNLPLPVDVLTPCLYKRR